MPLLPGGFLVLVVLTAVVAPVVAPGDPSIGELRDSLLPPAWMQGGEPAHPLGTDRVGRDLLQRLVHGARISLSVAAVSVVAAISIGGTLGVVAGYAGGLAEQMIMRVVDMMLAMPVILLALVIAVVFGPGVQNVVVVAILVLWSQYARVTRAETLSIRARDYLVSARAIGCSAPRIVTRHVVPNLLHSVIVLATLQLGFVIILEAALSFLGAGVPPPMPAWGLMVSEGRDYLTSAWWLALLPGAAIASVVMCVNLLGDWLRDRLDPYLRTVM